MLHCDYACSSLCGKKSLRGKFAPVGAQTSCDIFAELVVELKVGGLLEAGIDFVLGHGVLLGGDTEFGVNLNSEFAVRLYFGYIINACYMK
jgi:hypothetical protein